MLFLVLGKQRRKDISPPLKTSFATPRAVTLVAIEQFETAESFHMLVCLTIICGMFHSSPTSGYEEGQENITTYVHPRQKEQLTFVSPYPPVCGGEG